MFYSQHKQDEFLEKKIFKGYNFGIFVDIGAHDGVNINNTLYFEKEHKWQGYNVEPNKEVYNKLINNRPNSININCAIHEDECIQDFILNDGYTEMLSGLKREYDSRHLNRLKNELLTYGGVSNIIKIETKKLSSLFSEYNIKYVNYLSIDVEGAEFSIIKSIDFDKVFIDVIEFENNYKDSSNVIIDYLCNKGYLLINTNITADIFMIHKNSKFLSDEIDIVK